MMNDEQFLEARLNRRTKAEDRALERLANREEAALHYVGELQRDDDVVYYINVRSRDGNLTGATKEFDHQFQAINYLIRNNYV